MQADTYNLDRQPDRQTDRLTDRQTGRQDNSVFFWYDLIVYGTFWLCVSA